MILTKEDAFMVLNGLPHMGPVTLSRLMEEFEHDPVKILKSNLRALQTVNGVGEVIADVIVNWKDYFNLAKEKADLEKRGGVFISYEHPGYPSLLTQIYDPPIGLYALGKARPSERTVAIVGSRKATLYGLKVAKTLAMELVSAGFCVVSGMARGIDTAAHEGALEAGGMTAAVLGCGADIVYPPENKDLYERIIHSGVVFSEFKMGYSPDKRSFPMRNRIVSGMAHAVIVVETNTNGGSMITARMGSEQGRQVFAVPGRIDQGSSRGCHQLIRDGAVLLTSIDDLLSELSYLKQAEFKFEETGKSVIGGNEVRQGFQFSVEEALIMKHLEGEMGLTTEAICQRTQLEAHQVAANLMLLELKKVLVKKADGTFEAA